MTADQTPLLPKPGPDAGIDDIQADIEHTREELGETIEALSAKADVKGRVKQKAADTKDRITEKAHESRDVVVEKAHAAQSAARDAVTDDTGNGETGCAADRGVDRGSRGDRPCGVAPPPVSQRQRQRAETSGPTGPGQSGITAAAAAYRRRHAGGNTRILAGRAPGNLLPKHLPMLAGEPPAAAPATASVASPSPPHPTHETVPSQHTSTSQGVATTT